MKISKYESNCQRLAAVIRQQTKKSTVELQVATGKTFHSSENDSLQIPRVKNKPMYKKKNLTDGSLSFSRL